MAGVSYTPLEDNDVSIFNNADEFTSMQFGEIKVTF